jgi:thiol-disulfide isomerase/thioredoxin
MPREIIYEIPNINAFQEILANNPGVTIIKFGATWCGPCRRIEKPLHVYIKQMPDNVQSVIVDIDNCPEIYSFMKSRRMVNGVPALLAYKKGNNTHVPDDMNVGADMLQLQEFFKRCYAMSVSL